MAPRTVTVAMLLLSWAVGSAFAQDTGSEIPAVRVRIGNGESVPNHIVRPPQAISYTYPSYTDEARRLGIEGIVTVEAEFDINGNFQILRIVRGIGFGLDENALAALRDWRFLPAQRNGARVRVVAQIDIGFNRPNDVAKELWDSAVPIGAGVSPPSIVTRVSPQNPPEARAEGLQGTVVLKAVVLEDGSIQVVGLTQGLGSGLDENAIRALEQWTFRPGTREDKPVKVRLNVEISFSLG